MRTILIISIWAVSFNIVYAQKNILPSYALWKSYSTQYINNVGPYFDTTGRSSFSNLYYAINQVDSVQYKKLAQLISVASDSIKDAEIYLEIWYGEGEETIVYLRAFVIGKIRISFVTYDVLKNTVEMNIYGEIARVSWLKRLREDRKRCIQRKCYTDEPRLLSHIKDGEIMQSWLNH
jgi:hypothetical protein